MLTASIPWYLSEISCKDFILYISINCRWFCRESETVLTLKAKRIKIRNIWTQDGKIWNPYLGSNLAQQIYLKVWLPHFGEKKKAQLRGKLLYTKLALAMHIVHWFRNGDINILFFLCGEKLLLKIARTVGKVVGKFRKKFEKRMI